MKSKLFYLPLGILTVMSSASGLVLAGGSVQAASGSTNLKVTVTNACSFYSGSNGSSSKTASSSTTEFANVSTYQTVCNYSSGLKVYAVGYTNDVYGRTYMNGGNSGNIATGTATSGNTSNWAFKIADGGNTSYPATIPSTYQSYASIPSTSTVVASYGGVTTTTSGMKFKTSYRVYTAGAQAAGTYTGKVKYTVLNAGASAPTS